MLVEDIDDDLRLRTTLDLLKNINVVRTKKKGNGFRRHKGWFKIQD